ncbi:MAG: cyanophycinase [Gemmatimonadota bacterium]|jgi:cyanophycinase
MRRSLLIPLLGLLACSPGTTNTSSGTGTLFIVGGGARPPELMQQFVDLAGGVGAQIVVLPMASATPDETGAQQAEQLRQLGADARSVVLTHTQAMDSGAADLVAGADGVWFPGGDQTRLTAALQGTPVLAALRRRWQGGAVVGGTSAGAAVMSDSMITGSQLDAQADTMGYFGDEFPRVARGVMELQPGFGFVTNAIVDQHFIRRERLNRLLSVVLSHPDRLGVGIDESTALVVRPDGTWHVVGASAVIVLDARRARISSRGTPLSASDVRLHVLPAGATFDPRVPS